MGSRNPLTSSKRLYLPSFCVQKSLAVCYQRHVPSLVAPTAKDKYICGFAVVRPEVVGHIHFSSFSIASALCLRIRRSLKLSGVRIAYSPPYRMLRINQTSIFHWRGEIVGNTQTSSVHQEEKEKVIRSHLMHPGKQLGTILWTPDFKWSSSSWGHSHAMSKLNISNGSDIPIKLYLILKIIKLASFLTERFQ